MSREVTVFINDEAVFVFDDTKQLEQGHLDFLDKMDSDMARGIKIKGALIENPDNDQRRLFVTMNLLKALRQENEAIIQASSSYLINRCPELSQIKINDGASGLDFEFINQVD